MVACQNQKDMWRCGESQYFNGYEAEDPGTDENGDPVYLRDFFPGIPPFLFVLYCCCCVTSYILEVCWNVVPLLSSLRMYFMNRYVSSCERHEDIRLFIESATRRVEAIVYHSSGSASDRCAHFILEVCRTEMWFDSWIAYVRTASGMYVYRVPNATEKHEVLLEQQAPSGQKFSSGGANDRWHHIRRRKKLVHPDDSTSR